MLTALAIVFVVIVVLLYLIDRDIRKQDALWKEEQLNNSKRR